MIMKFLPLKLLEGIPELMKVPFNFLDEWKYFKIKYVWMAHLLLT